MKNFLVLALSALLTMPCVLRAEEVVIPLMEVISILPTKYASSDDYIPFLGNTSWTTIYHNMNDSHAWAYVSQYVGDSIINEKHYKMIKHYYLSMENPTLFPTNEPSNRVLLLICRDFRVKKKQKNLHISEKCSNFAA